MIESEPIARDREILGGIPVFTGTRVPIKNLLDYLAAGASSDEFWMLFLPWNGRRLGKR